MKKFLTTLPLILMIAGILFIAVLAQADPPPPPGGHGSGGNQPPVGAPIDGGLGILLAMGAVYGGNKLYKARKKKKNEDESDVPVNIEP